MSTETLRKAAALMRARAAAATPGRWHPFGTAIGAEVQGCTCGGGQEPYGHEQYCGVEGPVVEGHETDIEHIASWHPAVAYPVADWLDKCAARADMTSQVRLDRDPEEQDWYHPALTVARAYLGELA